MFYPRLVGVGGRGGTRTHKSFGHDILSVARIPIPPLALFVKFVKFTTYIFTTMGRLLVELAMRTDKTKDYYRIAINIIKRPQISLDIDTSIALVFTY
jgi:hypothetical protein